MPKMTPEQMDEVVRALIEQFVQLSSHLGSLKIEVQALREVLAENAPTAVAGYDERFSRLMNGYLDHLDSMVGQGKDVAVQLRMRRILEGYDGPKQ
jgi:hypothetical protein